MLLTIERLSLPDALLLSLVGFIIVFVALGIIISLIKAISYFSGAAERKTAPPLTDKPLGSFTVSTGKIPAPGSTGVCELNTVDDPTAAMLMAIVADELQVPLNELRFTSIREITEEDVT